MSLDLYIRAQRLNAERFRRTPHYAEMIVSLDAVYTRCLHIRPRSPEPIFEKSLLLCHRAFLSAASLTLQGQAEDAAAVARRGVELATFCLAYKGDQSRAAEWLAEKQRKARWGSRCREPRVSYGSGVQCRAADPTIAAELENWTSVFSDAYMYFVPELSADRQGRVSVKREERTAQTLLSYFVEDESLIYSVFFAIADSNASILRAFDCCYDGAFTDDVECMRLLARHSVVVQRLVTDIAHNPISSVVSRSAKVLDVTFVSQMQN
jgi:hypothetical protein